MSIKTTFVGSAGLLQVFGDTKGNTIIVSRDADGTLRVNGNTIVDDGVVANVNNTLLISVFGAAGNDRITLDESNGPLPKANLFGGAGNDVITAGSGADQIFGDAGNDTLDGKGGDDLLFGGAGNDVLIGGTGSDQLFGGSGNDLFVWNPGDGSDVVDGGSGNDTLDFIGAGADETVNISANADFSVAFNRSPGNISMHLTDVERIEFDALGGADNIVVGDLTGTAVKDVVIDLGPADGKDDSVTITGTAGNDVISANGNGTLTINGLAATVTIKQFESGHDTLIIDGGLGDDVILGSRFDDIIDGGRGSDEMFGGAGNDVFVWDPGDGSDVMDGQSGSDTLLFNGADIGEAFDISAIAGGDVRLSRDIGSLVTQDMDGVETIELNTFGGSDTVVINDLTGTDVKNVHVQLAPTADGDDTADTVLVNGTDGDDVITLTIENGSLVINGLASKVVIDNFDPELDTIKIAGLGGNDVIDASAIGVNGPKLIFDGGDGDDVLIGGAGNDTLLGGAGDDVLLGGPGADVLDGQGGDNVVIQDFGAFQGWIEASAVKDLHLA